MNIKEKIIYIAENKGITKKEFFQSIDMDPSSFTGDAKNRPLNSSAIQKVIELYNVNPDWLLTGKGEMLREPPPAEAHKDASSRAAPSATGTTPMVREPESPSYGARVGPMFPVSDIFPNKDLEEAKEAYKQLAKAEQRVAEAERGRADAEQRVAEAERGRAEAYKLLAEERGKKK